MTYIRHLYIEQLLLLSKNGTLLLLHYIMLLMLAAVSSSGSITRELAAYTRPHGTILPLSHSKTPFGAVAIDPSFVATEQTWVQLHLEGAQLLMQANDLECEHGTLASSWNE